MTERALTTKEKNRAKILEYCGNPCNEFPTRTQMAEDIIGYKDMSTLYKFFTPDELCEIEREALEIRRKKYNPEIAKVDIALMEKAATGDTAAAKLVYQRFEGWSEKQIQEHTGSISANISELTKDDLLKIASGK